MTHNPFVGSQLFFGRHRELNRLQTTLGRGESVLVVGGRRAGKTRLLANVRLPIRALYRADGQAWRRHEESDILEELGGVLGHPCASREELKELFRERAPFAMLIDEADCLLNEPWSGSFFAWLRSIDGDGANGLGPLVAFALAGGPVLYGWRNAVDDESPPLNLADPVVLDPLDRRAVAEMASLVDLDEDLLLELEHEAGGHPWMLERILRELADGEVWDEAIQLAFQHCVKSFRVWQRQLGAAGSAVLRKVGDDGCGPDVIPPRGRYAEPSLMARCMGLLRRRVNSKGRFNGYDPVPWLFRGWLDDVPVELELWDLAISFASEDEVLASAIKRQLAGFKVFQAHDEAAFLWSENLRNVLPNLFGQRARCVLVLSSEHYVRKHWTMVEWEAATRELGQARVLVVNLGAVPEGIDPDVLYMDGAEPRDMIALVPALRQIMLDLGAVERGA